MGKRAQIDTALDTHGPPCAYPAAHSRAAGYALDLTDQETQALGTRNRLRPFFDRELHEDVFDVRLYCFRSDTQFQCDLFVRSALADLFGNVALARGSRTAQRPSRVCGQIRLMDFRDLRYSVQERVASVRFN